MTPQERKALEDFVAAVRARYGARLVDVLVFGSRARGDAEPDSDVDLAIILEDGDWKFFDEKMALCDIAYDLLLETGLFIQSWPVAASVWTGAVTSRTPPFVIGARREARPVGEAA